ncbi:MAG TPA: CHAT domain-containing protein [Thermoanaerobaculia bacterium]|nr:CHAT domain-containing protein [Thermoanaerobaculia bacterium]
MTIDEIQKHSGEDLAAAYYVRAQWKNDPGDLLMAWREANILASRSKDDPRVLFNLALIQEQLALSDLAAENWKRVVALDRSRWGNEAREHLDRLNAKKEVWREVELKNALERGQRATLTRLVQKFPAESQGYFESHAGPELLADVLFESGDPYARAIAEAAKNPGARADFDAALAALQAAHSDPEHAEAHFDEAEALFVKAKNPMVLTARFARAAQLYTSYHSKEALKFLPTVVAEARAHGYRDLLFRAEILLATCYSDVAQYTEAFQIYKRYETSANPNYAASVLARRAITWHTLGDLDAAWNDVFRALILLPRVTDLITVGTTYGTASEVTQSAKHPELALNYQELGVRDATSAVRENPRDQSARINYTAALRLRAGALLALGRIEEAAHDLERSRASLKLVRDPKNRAALEFRIEELTAQIESKSNPAAAIRRLTVLIDNTEGENPTVYAGLLLRRAAAHRLENHHELADADIDAALAVIRSEQNTFLSMRNRGALEQLWSEYFSRFLPSYHERIASYLEKGEHEAALVTAEQAKAFEPLHLLMQSQKTPKGFAPINTIADLNRLRATLPANTFIIQYAVLERSVESWVISRDAPIPSYVPLPASPQDVSRWLENLRKAKSEGNESSFQTNLKAAYDGLIAGPWSAIQKTDATPRIIIVPDGPMHGLPFSALAYRKGGKLRYLANDAIVSLDGSTSLYFYSVARDAEFRNQPPNVLAVGDPLFRRDYPGTESLHPLRHARQEATRLKDLYGPSTTLLLGKDATIPAFLKGLRRNTIVHFGGHGIANETQPGASMLLLAPSGNDSGRLTAERLITEVLTLEQTRLVVLAACSTAGGQPVGPEGVAALVRPFLAANVPAVVGSLWDVEDATTNQLLVSFHCHYRNGSDVAVALREAQLAMIRDNKSSFDWAPFQVIGYAASPHKDQNIEFSCQDFLLGADGPRSQSERH